MMAEKETKRYWIFSNNKSGYYGDSDWDMSTIIRTNHYYLKEKERNRTYIRSGHIVFMRNYGEGYIGKFEINGDWVEDGESFEKYQEHAGYFPMTNMETWSRTLPQELIARELSNHDVRSRIVSITETDNTIIDTAHKIYEKLGYGNADGEIIILEKGIEEAIKPNLAQLGLKLADKSIQQQFSMGPGVGRSDLICLDSENNLVIIELKRGLTSDQAVGQIFRYIGYVKENVAEEGQEVRGVILTTEYDESLRYATMGSGLKVYRVRIV